MNTGLLLWFVLICITLYKIIDLSLRRYERFKAMQKLEGEQLVEYLGKSEPDPQGDPLRQSLWWLLRAGSVALGIGIPFICSPFFAEIECKANMGQVGQMSMVGAMILLSAVFLIIELLIERKVRK